jgi:hypothetical protein
MSVEAGGQRLRILPWRTLSTSLTPATNVAENPYATLPRAFGRSIGSSALIFASASSMTHMCEL